MFQFRDCFCLVFCRVVESPCTAYLQVINAVWFEERIEVCGWYSCLLAATEPMQNLYDAIRIDCGLPEIRGYRSGGNPEVAVHQLICDLMQISAFKHNPGRGGHPSFPKFSSNLLQNLDYRDLHTWMNGLIKTWEPIYELNRV